jgi:hypothetical protein
LQVLGPARGTSAGDQRAPLVRPPLTPDPPLTHLPTPVPPATGTIGTTPELRSKRGRSTGLLYFANLPGDAPRGLAEACDLMENRDPVDGRCTWR